MKKHIKVFIQFTLLIFLCSSLNAQIISIEKIKAVPQPEFYETKDSSLVFPVFRLKSKKAEQKINRKLVDDFKKDRDIDKRENNIRSMLVAASKEGLTDFDFEIWYQTKKIISFSFQWGATAAYPTTWQTQYCFDLDTGNLITLDSLIDKKRMKEFLNVVKNKQQININNNKTNLSEQLRKKDIDKETYQWALDQMKGNCWSSYGPKNFTITKNTLTVIVECDFPHAIRALSPDSDIALPLKKTEQYFNKKYKYLLH
jgi:hypothetical protein